MDKFGHLYSAFYLSQGSARALQWAGIDKNKSNLIGSISGFLFLLPIELMDGYSTAYGASIGDVAADFAGAGIFYIQKLAWKELRIYPKFSFHHTHFSALRPSVLGDNAISELLKDYNGQTYWLNIDLTRFLKVPEWLDISIGYGAEEMVFARSSQNSENGYHDYRQFFLAPDFDLRAIRTHSPVVKTLLDLSRMIKLPAPTLEISNGKAIFHWLYF